MCGIVAAIAERNVGPILIAGLKRLEYRGYDSAGLALYHDKKITRVRREGKVAALESAAQEANVAGFSGIAHTRWATHGKPVERNAHPHMSGDDIAVVHNGIIENYETLRSELQQQGYEFSSDTDTEVVGHLLHRELQSTPDIFDAFKKVVAQLEGAYALAVINTGIPDEILAVRCGSPLVAGLGIGENFLASDQLALLPVTTQFIFLEEGDFVRMTRMAVSVWNRKGELVERPVPQFEGSHEDAEKGEYRHYMLKEIFEQPAAIQRTLDGRTASPEILLEAFGEQAGKLFDELQQVQIIACGTSSHAGMVARYWLESLAGVACQVEVASEFRYRKHVVPANTLMVTISQSGETADTLAALRASKDENYLARLAICNVPSSSLVRESEISLLTHAGPEVGVASTKAFTTQLVALYLLVLAVAHRKQKISTEQFETRMTELRQLPSLIEQTLQLDTRIEKLSEAFVEKNHTLFLGRGPQYPLAMEGALKLKEISYIHAEAYPAGELKHGPLALVDNEMPVVAVAPNDELLEKLKSNLQEVRARGGELFVFADRSAGVEEDDGIHVLNVPPTPEALIPMVYAIPLQLLSYHVAVMRGTDVDQPRNLAKSVTVE